MIRAGLVSSLLCLPLAAALAQDAPRPSPSAEVAAIASRIDACGGAELAFVGSFTSVHVIPGHAWILSAYTADLPPFEAEYVVVSTIDGALTVEQLTGPGETRVLEAEAAATYLRRVGLETRPLAEAFQRHYAPRPPGGG